MNVVILFGGRSVEHDISIITYFQILNSIDTKKYNVIPVYMGKDNRFFISKKIMDINVYKESDYRSFKEVNFIRKGKKTYIKNKQVDVVLLACHGKGLEDGTLAGFLSIYDLPVVSPSLKVSNVFHNKYLTKLILEKNKISTLEYVYINQSKWEKNNTEYLKSIEKMKKKIIKPASLGSSIGVKICTDIKDTEKEIENAFKYDDELIIEKCLNTFTEFNQAVYQYKDETYISRIEEVQKNNELYDFEDKYLSRNTKRIIPARIANGLKNRITKTTKRIMEIFNDKGIIRIDYLYDNEENKLYVNEINVIPGSLAYYLFEAKDIYFSSILDNLITEAIHCKEKEKMKITSFQSSVLLGHVNNKK